MVGQSNVIKTAINQCLDDGMTDKSEIYTKVVDTLKVPRPTVRRVCKDLVDEMHQKLKILEPFAESVS